MGTRIVSKKSKQKRGGITNMKRLTYEKINNSNDVVKIDLHNGYTVIAISGWNPVKKCYTTTLSLKHNSVDTTTLIEKAESLEFYTNAKTINSAILKKVSTYLNEGFFDHYIERYKYEMHCFDLGNEIIESERRYHAS